MIGSGRRVDVTTSGGGPGGEEGKTSWQAAPHGHGWDAERGGRNDTAATASTILHTQRGGEEEGKEDKRFCKICCADLGQETNFLLKIKHVKDCVGLHGEALPGQKELLLSGMDAVARWLQVCTCLSVVGKVDVWKKWKLCAHVPIPMSK